MKAVQIRSHGGVEVLQVAEVPAPTPQSGEILVRIKASALNPLDGIVRRGYFPIAQKPPLILGEEAGGVVERDAAGFKAGDRVLVYGNGLGVFRNGTWAELVSVPLTAVRHLPSQISFEEGAAIPNVGVTAYGALRTAELKAREVLVVLGATGGVGTAGIQIGKAIGARVIGVVSTPDKASTIQSLGADEIISLSAGSLAEQVQKLTKGRGADVILDPVGGEVSGKAMAALVSFGRLVHLGYSAGTNLTINSLDLIAKPSQILGFNIFMLPPERSARDLQEVISFAEARKYRPLVGKTFPVNDVVAATEFFESRSVAGKVVLMF